MKKTIKVEVELPIWEAFFRIFPGQGERSGYLRRVILKTIDQADKIDALLEKAVTEAMVEERMKQ